HFRRGDLLAVGRHVSAARRAIADLVDKLVPRHTVADERQVRSALAALAFESMAIAAILVLEHDCALELERRASLYDFHRHRIAAPCGHLGRPRRSYALLGQD